MIKNIVLFIGAVLAISATASYFVADYVVRNTPVAAQIMVVDVAQVIGDGKDNDSAFERKTAELKAIIAEAADKGIIVLDADAVIKAPSEAYIRLEVK